MAKWLCLKGPFGDFAPQDPPTLTPLGWKAVFEVCTPPKLSFLFRHRPFISVQGWTDVVEGYLLASVVERKAPRKAKPGKVEKPPQHPAHGMRGSRAPPRVDPPSSELVMDRRLGMKRQVISSARFQELLRCKSKRSQLQFLLDDAKTRRLPQMVKRFSAALDELPKQQHGAGAGKPSQSSFGARRSSRRGQRQDYSLRGQRDRHEGRIHVVSESEVSDGPDDEAKEPLPDAAPARPDSPYPYPDGSPVEEEEEETQLVPYLHNYADEREYTDDSEVEEHLRQYWH